MKMPIANVDMESMLYVDGECKYLSYKEFITLYLITLVNLSLKIQRKIVFFSTLFCFRLEPAVIKATCKIRWLLGAAP